jgi:hypothetical protein
LAGWLLFGGAPGPGATGGSSPTSASAPGEASATSDAADAADATNATGAADATAEIEALREELAREVGRREALEQALSERAAASPAEAPTPGAPTAPGPPAAANAKPRENWLDEPVLVAAGFTPAEAEALRRRFEAIELERLFVRDQATREGWFGAPRFQQRMRELNAEYDVLREEHGDERYDWILFASGRNNRVVVDRVLPDSAASEVGLEPGDVFLAYDEERVFDAGALQRATSGGVFGETVGVDVLRDGERIRLYPSRGPLGVGLRVERREPDPLY